MLLNHLNIPEIDMVIASILRSTGGKEQTKTFQILIDCPNVTGLTNYRTKIITIITVILAMVDKPKGLRQAFSYRATAWVPRSKL